MLNDKYIINLGICFWWDSRIVKTVLDKTGKYRISKYMILEQKTEFNHRGTKG